ncbi:hypothetical protein GCM10011507_34140 [Edaphobacter acidisoli]|uniref:Uncharacterized protein n=1 Tax=Edaphobacter acidisoli TaxID=2040573 RepID=A0A916S491_9BACT|nr:hypothetical protein [Edaphobacter acidisoli]GGA80058.1 hypothetical protein GCM10011507_34140 [Edaphobacter acidisoli]
MKLREIPGTKLGEPLVLDLGGHLQGLGPGGVAVLGDLLWIKPSSDMPIKKQETSPMIRRIHAQQALADSGAKFVTGAINGLLISIALWTLLAMGFYAIHVAFVAHINWTPRSGLWSIIAIARLLHK